MTCLCFEFLKPTQVYHFLPIPFTPATMQEVKKRRQIVIPSFGDWDTCDEIQITQYFESARQAGLIHGQSFRTVDVDLFKVIPPSPLHYYNYRKPRRVVVEKLNRQQQQYKVKGRVKQQGKQGRVFDVVQPQRIRARTAKAVDEDLYKIPPELLYQKPNRRVMLTNLWKKCMSLNCVP